MNTSRVHSWFNTKLQIADLIVAEYPEAGADDAGILLSCAASAFAARMWPGQRMDRVRFVQYLVTFSSPDLQLSHISVPVLQEKLRDRGEIAISNTLEGHFYPDAGLRLLNSSESDQPDDRILSLIHELPLREVRLCSHASIIYSEYRSALVHRYSLSSYLSSIPGQNHPDKPSYMNWLIEPEAEVIEDLAEELGITIEEVKSSIMRNMRRLHFPYRFVRTVISSAAENAQAFWNEADSWRKPRPETWWLEGGSVE